MGTIAARDCLRVLELVEQVAAGSLLAAAQGIRLRLQLEPTRDCPIGLSRLAESLAPSVMEDRRLDGELIHLLLRVRGKHL